MRSDSAARPRGSAQPGTVQLSNAQPSAAQPGSAQSGTAQSGSAERSGSVEPPGRAALADRPGSSARPARKGELIGEDWRVYDCVLDAVMAHRLPPGTKLVESALGELLGVSRTVVRMGLLRLAHDRIVELLPNRGAAVARPTVAQAHEVYAARRLIEGAIAASLASRLPAARLAELRRIVERGHAAFERDDDAAKWIRQAGDFHVQLARCTRNAILADSVRELVTRSNLITALYLEPGRTVYARDARLALIDALAERAPDAPGRAKAAMETLLSEVESRLRPRREPIQRVDLRDALQPARP